MSLGKRWTPDLAADFGSLSLPHCCLNGKRKSCSYLPGFLLPGSTRQVWTLSQQSTAISSKPSLSNALKPHQPYIYSNIVQQCPTYSNYSAMYSSLCLKVTNSEKGKGLRLAPLGHQGGWCHARPLTGDDLAHKSQDFARLQEVLWITGCWGFKLDDNGGVPGRNEKAQLLEAFES